MKVVIDTSSLLSLVRYYLPFDKNNILYLFFQQKIQKGEIIIIDKVLTECTFNSRGLVIKKLPYLNDKAFLKTAKTPVNTDSLIAPNTKQFLHQLSNVFVNAVIKKSRGITEVEFEKSKSDFLETADMKQVIFCLNQLKEGEQVLLVTEETENSNDGKLFKKLPFICKELGIETLTLPELITRYEGIDIDFQQED
jgi:hypothetical protein